MRWFAAVALLAALAALVPWGRESPRHRFMLQMLQRLEESDAPNHSVPTEGTR